MMLHALLQRLDTETIGQGALILIVGGLFMLALVLSLVLLRSIFPTGASSEGLSRDELQRRILTTAYTPSHAAQTTTAQPLAQDRYQAGQQEAQRRGFPNLDAVLDSLEQNRRGKPRLLRHRDDLTLIRIHECAECRDPSLEGGCAFQTGFLQAAIQALGSARAEASEVACVRTGAPACEIEVRH